MTPQERAIRVRQMGARHDWWALRREPALDPEQEVVDAHFHLWDARDFPDPAAPGAMLQTSRYLLEEFLAATSAGHKVVQAVYVECGSGYRVDGPEHLRAAGRRNGRPAWRRSRRITTERKGSQALSRMRICRIASWICYSSSTRRPVLAACAASARVQPVSRRSVGASAGRGRAAWPLCRSGLPAGPCACGGAWPRLRCLLVPFPAG